jgi:GalNAc5-diNAcBac-PP-undecaprenol beta-1,3-glucosyltransferase
MATFNRAHFIEETLITIQNQTYTHWECLIIDDGGNDGTENVISPILAKDSRFKYYHRSVTYQKGLPGCRNFGLDLSKGEYVIFFDDDDIVHPLNLELCVSKLLTEDVSYCRYIRKAFTGDFDYHFDMQKECNSFYIEENDYQKIVTGLLPFNSCAVMWKKECFNDIRFNESLMYAEEWECYTRILTSGIRGISIDKTLFFGRKHPNSNTGEFWNNDPLRRASKVEACRLVINHLAQNKLLTYRLGVYFVSLAHFHNEKQIFDALVAHKPKFNSIENFLLNVRYFANNMIKPIYKLKKRLA